jgi:hypothetical protein
MIFANQNIQVIGTKTIGQAKITGTIIENFEYESHCFTKVAVVVLGEKCFGAAIVFVAIYRGGFEYYDGIFKQEQSSTNFDC